MPGADDPPSCSLLSSLSVDGNAAAAGVDAVDDAEFGFVPYGCVAGGVGCVLVCVLFCSALLMGGSPPPLLLAEKRPDAERDSTPIILVELFKVAAKSLRLDRNAAVLDGGMGAPVLPVRV